MCARASVRARACVCERLHVRERVGACVFAHTGHMRAHVKLCMYVSVYACACACRCGRACVCVCKCGPAYLRFVWACVRVYMHVGI